METESRANTSLIVEAQPTEPGSRRVNVKRMLRLRLRAMAAAFLVLAVPGLLVVWRKVPLEYTATADVRFLAAAPRVLHDSDGGQLPATYDKFLNTQVNLITGGAVLSRVLEDPEVQGLACIRRQADPLAFLRSHVEAKVRQNSELVTITCTLPDRDEAKLIVEKSLAVYMSYALGEEADAGGERLRVLLRERDDRQAELDTLLARSSELQRELGVPMASAEQLGVKDTETYREILARAEEDAARAQTRIATAEEEVKRLAKIKEEQATGSSSAIFAFGIEDEVAEDPRVTTLRQDLVQAEASFARASQRYADGSPQLEVEREDLSSLRGKVSQTERAVREDVVSSMLARSTEALAAAREQAADAARRQETFEQLVEKQHKRAMDASRTLAELDELKLRTEETRNVLRTLREQATSIGVESNAPARVKVASPTTVPLAPEAGRRLQLILLTLLSSAAAALGVGFLRELTDQQVRSAKDVVDVTNKPVLAAIPHTSVADAKEPEVLATLAADHPESAAANEFRNILSRLAFANDDAIAEINSCLVTSPTQGDGKTTVACNLAIALAAANRNVLLVDISPAGHVERHFGLEPARGLTEVLSGGYAFRDVVRPTVYRGLCVLGPGFNVEQLAPKLASRELTQLLEEAEQLFDHVIIDAPPSLLLSDAKLLAPVVDGVLLVVGAGVSTLGMVRRCVAELERLDSHILGVVINAIRPSAGGYLQKNLELFNTYHAGERRRTIDRELPKIQVLDVEPDEVADTVEPILQDTARK